MSVNGTSGAVSFFSDNMVLFTRELRAAGIPISLGQVQDFLRALELVQIGDREQVFHAARAMLIGRHEHLRLFEALFNRFFTRARALEATPQTMPRAPRHKTHEKPFDITTYMAYKARLFDEEVDVGEKSETYSAAEVLQHKDFSLLTPDELDTLKQVMQSMDWRISRRLTRRRMLDRRGDMLHLRKVIARAARLGGIPAQLAWQTRKEKPRPVVLIADISGSMEKYSRVLLLFFHCVTQRMLGVQSFVFGTRLSCITPQLKLKNIDVAIDQAGHDVADWAGGTRIGDSLAEFNRRWAKRVLHRGALCIIVSDGWERGDVLKLRREMRYLQHRCHRLIWLNPLVGQQSYQPRVDGMAAALPFIDDFLPVHNLESLIDLNRRLAALPHSAARQNAR